MDLIMNKFFRFNFFYVIPLLLINFFISNNVIAQNGSNLYGVVVDSETNSPIVGVSVRVTGEKNATITNTEGKYSIIVGKGAKSLTFSSVGYVSRKMLIRDTVKEINVELVSESSNLDEIVVTGVFNMRKESFSGASKTINAEEIRAVGNKNVLQALKTLDPSISFIENNLRGSDPNSLAQIQLRGQTSVSSSSAISNFQDQLGVDPNMPLFILDGFEATLRQVTDLDINRIASVTILKDAASTSLYGSKAANGVIVVETIRPKEGEMFISYDVDFNFNIADLSDFNYMNAREKLEYERLAGVYSKPNDDFVRHLYDHLYNDRLRKVQSGVDTYWLNEPLVSVATENRHSIKASGGSSKFQYSVGGSYQAINGVMKGSGRKNWGANANLIYRSDRFNISNEIFLGGNKSQDSPYGSFSTFTRTNPYYVKDDFSKRYLEEITVNTTGGKRLIPNPMYNSSLNNESYQNQFDIRNNLGFNFDVNKDLRFAGAFQISRGFGTDVSFVSPLHTDFDSSPIQLRGLYTDNTLNIYSYTGNISSSYKKIFKEKSVVTANVRAEISEKGNNTKGFAAVGFPAGLEGNPAFAYAYINDSKPSISNPPIIRRLSTLASVNYYYDNRFFIDGVFRLEGATSFGSDNLYSPFWSMGLGWNLHNESFIKELESVNRFVIRGNVGTTGNQSFGTFYSTTVYRLNNNTNYFGLGFEHTDLANPSLKWQKTQQLSLGVELKLFNDRLSARFDGYSKLTDPLIISLDLPPSLGAISVPMNAGAMTVKGLEVEVGCAPVINLDKRIIWNINLTGAISKGRYSNFGQLSKSLNNEQLKNSSLLRFTDGRGPNDLWALKSLGIDPATGLEMFLTEEDTYTYEYTLANQRVVGNANPVIQGVFGSNLRIGNFNANIFIRYNLGAYRFNNSLYNKVENISSSDLDYNQDKRALYNTWKNPGDVVSFKSIKNTSFTPISSRFIQRENIISGESISLGYEFNRVYYPWLKSIGVSRLNINGYMNDIFRISNILNERGVDYPFARAVSFSFRASF